MFCLAKPSKMAALMAAGTGRELWLLLVWMSADDEEVESSAEAKAAAALLEMSIILLGFHCSAYTLCSKARSFVKKCSLMNTAKWNF